MARFLLNVAIGFHLGLYFLFMLIAVPSTLCMEAVEMQIDRLRKAIGGE